jgi:hypothetical protein
VSDAVEDAFLGKLQARTLAAVGNLRYKDVFLARLHTVPFYADCVLRINMFAIIKNTMYMVAH